MAIIVLTREYPSRHGAPAIARVDDQVFSRRYFAHCTRCDFCADWCCRCGVDVDAHNVERILAHAAALEPLTGIRRERWFERRWREDPEVPGGRYTRARVAGGGCVFLDRRGRGCHLHRYALAVGLDYHELKPMVSALFPLTFDFGMLHASDEVEEDRLLCRDVGETLYRGVRDELQFYFGPELVSELDSLEDRR